MKQTSFFQIVAGIGNFFQLTYAYYDYFLIPFYIFKSMTTSHQYPYWQVHDKFFKEIFTYRAVFSSFIEQYILRRFTNLQDLVTITPIRNKSVDSKLSVLFSDLIFELMTSSEDRFYVLFEHKSYEDKYIEKQLIKYMDTFELDFLKEYPESKVPLTIIPVLIYHGLDNWNIRFDNARLANLVFFDLSHMTDKQIKGTAILRIVLLTLKYIRSEELVTKIDMMLELFMELKDDPAAKEYLRMFSFYIEHAAREEMREMLNQKIRHYFTEEELESSSLIKWLEERGMERGMEKGMEKGIEQGIEIGADAMRLIITTNKTDEEIADTTKIPVEKIREFRKKI